eukprot:1150870-Pelagomonas_calceolata.AAC.11
MEEEDEEDMGSLRVGGCDAGREKKSSMRTMVLDAPSTVPCSAGPSAHFAGCKAPWLVPALVVVLCLVAPGAAACAGSPPTDATPAAVDGDDDDGGGAMGPCWLCSGCWAGSRLGCHDLSRPAAAAVAAAAAVVARGHLDGGTMIQM